MRPRSDWSGNGQTSTASLAPDAGAGPGGRRETLERTLTVGLARPGDPSRVMTHAPEPGRPTVVLMCGLPASGKTTTAGRLHARLGGTLIRSCDVYQRLGIDLPDWVAKTRGFTENVGAYERVRDQAYAEMARLLDGSLTAGAAPVVVDAVHGERAKRAVVFDLCRRHAAAPVLVWCRCDELAETERRLAARRGREVEPEREASDVSVYRHIVSLWDDPLEEDGRMDVVVYDTRAGTACWVRRGQSDRRELIQATLVGPATNCSRPGPDA
jgi:predicted kinase